MLELGNGLSRRLDKDGIPSDDPLRDQTPKQSFDLLLSFVSYLTVTILKGLGLLLVRLVFQESVSCIAVSFI